MCCLLLNMCFRSGKLKTDLQLSEAEEDIPYQKAATSTTERREDDPADNEDIFQQKCSKITTVDEKTSDNEYTNIEIHEHVITKPIKSKCEETFGETKSSEEHGIDCGNGVAEKNEKLNTNSMGQINDYLIVEYVYPIPEVTVILDQDVAEYSTVVIGKDGAKSDDNIEPEFQNKHVETLNNTHLIISGEDLRTEKSDTMISNESSEAELLDLNIEKQLKPNQEDNALGENISECIMDPKNNNSISDEIFEQESSNCDNYILMTNEVLQIIDENNVDTKFKGDEPAEENPHSEGYPDKHPKVVDIEMGNKMDNIEISSCGDSDPNTNCS